MLKKLLYIYLFFSLSLSSLAISSHCLTANAYFQEFFFVNLFSEFMHWKKKNLCGGFVHLKRVKLGVALCMSKNSAQTTNNPILECCKLRFARSLTWVYSSPIIAPISHTYPISPLLFFLFLLLLLLPQFSNFILFLLWLKAIPKKLKIINVDFDDASSGHCFRS